MISETVAHLLPLNIIRAWCDQQPIVRLSLFGSALRKDFTIVSDIDLLVEYHPEARVSLLDMAQHQIDLEAIIGRKVDLRTAYELSPYFRQQVLEQAVTVYERA
jgi:predicted nucleotidyltransferase